MLRSFKGLYHLLVACFSLVWFRFPARKLTVVGVTGTDGKTTTTTLVYQILTSAGIRASMITSVQAVIAGTSYDTGLHVTTPTAWWVQKYLRDAVDHGDTHMVLEVTSHGISQHRVFGIPFAVAILTNITHEHLDWHKTFTLYVKTKLSLLRKATIAVINRDESDVYDQAVPLLRNKRIITYGIRRKSMVTPKTHPFHTKLPGEFNRYNCLAALAAAEALGVPNTIARKTIASFSGVPGRMEVVASDPFTVIVDFAHTPNAIDRVLKTVRAMTRGRLIHVFGSAGLRDHTKRPLMGERSGRYADMIILTEEDYRTEDVRTIMDQIAKGIPTGVPVHRYPDRRDAIAFALAQARPGDLVIITGKGHEKSLARGKIEYPWSDGEAVKKHLPAGRQV